MTSAREQKLELRSMIPVFQLMSTEGQTVSLWDFKGRKNLVLVLLPGEECSECVGFLRLVKNSYSSYVVENAVCIAVVRGDIQKAQELHDQLDPPFPILYDPQGAATDRYTDRLPAVFIADRFGQLYAQWTIDPETDFPSQKRVLDIVELINLECPECGAPLEW